MLSLQNLTINLIIHYPKLVFVCTSCWTLSAVYFYKRQWHKSCKWNECILKRVHSKPNLIRLVLNLSTCTFNWRAEHQGRKTVKSSSRLPISPSKVSYPLNHLDENGTKILLTLFPRSDKTSNSQPLFINL